MTSIVTFTVVIEFSFIADLLETLRNRQYLKHINFSGKQVIKSKTQPPVLCNEDVPDSRASMEAGKNVKRVISTNYNFYK